MMTTSRRRVAITLGVVVVVLTLASVAWSSMAVRLRIAPANPHVGQRITLALSVYAPHVDPAQPCGFDRVPWRLSYPFRGQATAPDGTAYRIRMHQGDGNLYSGTLWLSKKPGIWTIRVLNFFNRYNKYDPCAGARLRFRVRP